MSDGPQRNFKTWPMRNVDVAVMSFSFVSASTVVPNVAAIPLSVSPLRTLYVEGAELAGTSVGSGVADADG